MKATEEKPAAKSVSGLLSTVLLLAAVCLVGIFLVRLDSQIPTVANTSQINADRRNKLVASIAAVGDIACKPGKPVSATECQMGAVAKSIEAGNHDAVLLLGDLQYDGGDKNSEQGKWLAADLNTHKNRCTLAFWHHPHFSSGRYKGGGFTPDFWDLLYSAHRSEEHTSELQ